jgi:predicted nucleic acid-binding protein
LDFENAAEAGEINETLKGKAKGWGLADSIILSTAMSLKGKVVTGDEHFRELEEVIFLKKYLDEASRVQTNGTQWEKGCRFRV